MVCSVINPCNYAAFLSFRRCHRSYHTPATRKVITSIVEGTSADVNIAVVAARKAFESVWGLKTNGTTRARLLLKLAELIQQHADKLAVTETLDNGFRYLASGYGIVQVAVDTFRYYAGCGGRQRQRVTRAGYASVTKPNRVTLGAEVL
jgi:aldehyde dehydrogenase (NAD+)